MGKIFGYAVPTNVGIAGLDFINIASYDVKPTATAAANGANMARLIADATAAGKKVIQVNIGTHLTDRGWKLPYNLKLTSTAGEDLCQFQATQTLSHADSPGYFFTRGDSQLYQPQSREVSGIGFQGGGFAEGALNLQCAAYFEYDHIYCTGHIAYAIKALGMLIGEFRNLNLEVGARGIQLLNRPGTIVPGSGSNSGVVNMPCNNVLLHKPKLTALTETALEWGFGTDLTIFQIDMEQCGVNNPAGRGSIWVHDTCSLNEGSGLHMIGGWIEQMNGGPCVYLDKAAGRTRSNIDNLQILRSQGYTSQVGIFVDGTNGIQNYLSLNSMSISDYTAGNSLIVAGSGGKAWVSPDSYINAGGLEQVGGKIYIGATTADVASNAGTGTTPGGGTGNTGGTAPGTGNASYSKEVLNDNPVYYNRMNGSGTSLAPTSGTGNVTVVGALVQSGFKPTAEADSNSVSFTKTSDQYASHPLNLSAYTEVAIEMIVRIVNGPQGNNLLFGHGPSVGVGGIILVPAQPNASYIAVGGDGNAFETAGPNYPLSLVGPDFFHLVVRYSNRQIVKYLVNGEPRAYTDSGTGQSNNNVLANATMFLANGFELGQGLACEIAEVAYYAGTIPTDARFKQHSTARANA